MAYTPTVWNTGDTITAEKLNKLENGVANVGGYDIVFTQTFSSFTADGLSVEELYQKGASNLSALFEINGSSSKALCCTAFNEDDIKEVDLYFLNHDIISLITIMSNGTGTFGNTNLTYTYSNGHYVFTPTGSNVPIGN